MTRVSNGRMSAPHASRQWTQAYTKPWYNRVLHDHHHRAGEVDHELMYDMSPCVLKLEAMFHASLLLPSMTESP